MTATAAHITTAHITTAHITTAHIDNTAHLADTTTRRFTLLKAGLAAGAVAAVANTLVVVAARAVDIPVAVGGESIPLLGFPQLTLVGALIGVLLARVLSRTSHARRYFLVTTVVLTALSLVPDLTADATPGTRAVLALTHVLAAALVIPALARRLHR